MTTRKYSVDFGGTVEVEVDGDLLAFEDGAPDDDWEDAATQAALEKVNDGSADIDLGPPERVDGVMVP